MANEELMARIGELSKLSKLVVDKHICTEAELKQIETLRVDSNQISVYLANSLKVAILLKSNMDLYAVSLANSDISSSVIFLIALLKSGKSVNRSSLEKVIKCILNNPDSERLSTILLIKSFLKHSKDQEPLHQTIIEYLAHIDPLQWIEQKYAGYYFLNKYLRCIRLCLDKKCINQQSFIESTLERLIDLVKELDSPRQIDDQICTSLLTNILKLIVLVALFSTQNLASDRFERLWSTLNTADGQFRPDIIYSGVSDDTEQIAFNLTCLERFLKPDNATNIASRLFEWAVNPVRLFWSLAASIQFDCELVVEWLITSETEFLVYFLKFLKYFAANVTSSVNLERALVSSASTTSTTNESINKLFDFLADLHAKLSSLKRSFPYNCEPLIKLLFNILNRVKSK